MPFRALVVNHRPKLDSFVVFEQEDVKGHTNSGAIQVVPKMQAEGTTIGAQRALQTCRVAVGDPITLKVQVEAICKKSLNCFVMEYLKN